MKRILFVDDEPSILDGIRRLLRSCRHEWDMTFAISGEAALDELDKAPFDVVVADMRMPRMDGATLLREVRNRYPAVVRMVLSGHSDVQDAIRAASVAHQFLAKPCDAALFKSTIDRACQLRSLLEDASLRAAVGARGTLPTIPRVYAELTDKLADPDASLADVTRIVSRDVALCAKILQLVNSSFFGLARRISDVQVAVTFLGTSMLKNLVLSAEVFESFGASRLPVAAVESLQKHSLVTAGIARRLLRDAQQAEDAFMAGMLHDIGWLVLPRFPEEPASRQRAGSGASEPRAVVGQKGEVNVTHAEVGAYLLGIWGLPYTIVGAVAHHHAPSRAGLCGLDVLAAVHVANSLAAENAPFDANDGSENRLDLEYIEAIGVANELPLWREMARDLVAEG